MKKRFEINKIDKKTILYKDLKCRLYQTENGIEKIINEIFDLNENANIKTVKIDDNKLLVSCDDKVICTMEICDDKNISKYRIKITYNEIEYEYSITDSPSSCKGVLDSYSFKKNNTQYIVSKKNEKLTMQVKQESKDERIASKGIHIYMPIFIDDDKMIFDMISNINCDNSLKEIYQIIEKYKKTYKVSSIKIKKYIIINTFDNKMVITDCLNIENGILYEYLITLNVNDKKVTIEKKNSNTKISMYDSSAEDIYSAYFQLNEQLEFIKKLEKKKEN